MKEHVDDANVVETTAATAAAVAGAAAAASQSGNAAGTAPQADPAAQSAQPDEARRDDAGDDQSASGEGTARRRRGRRGGRRRRRGGSAESTADAAANPGEEADEAVAAQASQPEFDFDDGQAAEAGKPAWDWQPAEADAELDSAVARQAEQGLADAYRITDKGERRDKVAEVKDAAAAVLAGTEEARWSEEEVKNALSRLEKRIVRDRVLQGEPRIDGRDQKTVRPISVEVGVLPRAHGSAIFTRGETQAIVVATLGTGRDAQIIDAIEGERKEPFMFHYNFPHYSVGETGFMGSPKRREIGHGKLARRGIQAVMPTTEEFPYVIRVVSEITESNGSSSMASVCGSSLALMDAGVPTKAAVAGVAMGLVKEGDRFAVLTDILGDEDHLGDMDFKVAGTSDGVTALQMDIKIQGITREIMNTALAQAKDARLHILGEMNAVINAPRTEMSEWAPTIMTFKIDPEKIRDVIGKGGAVIRAMTEETGATIDIENDGTVKVASVDGASGKEARRRIELITADVEVGRIYEGKVARLMDFGAFVTILPGKDGLVHISQISNERVEKVSDKLAEGDVVKGKVLEVDRQGRVRLSMKEVEAA